MVVAGEAVTLHAFHLVLSYSRGEAVVWARDRTRQPPLALRRHTAGGWPTRRLKARENDASDS